LTGLFVPTCWIGLAMTADPPKTNSSPVRWKTDLKAAQKEAQKTDRPMLIVFGAEWCTHCGRFERTTLSDPAMAAAINRDFVPVRLDFDKEQKTAEVMDVEALPCTVVLSPEADLLIRVVGAKPASEFQGVLKQAKVEHTRIRTARIAAASDDGSRN
jgi:thioredoxin-like negative regulator of GroEL